MGAVGGAAPGTHAPGPGATDPAAVAGGALGGAALSGGACGVSGLMPPVVESAMGDVGEPLGGAAEGGGAGADIVPRSVPACRGGAAASPSGEGSSGSGAVGVSSVSGGSIGTSGGLARSVTDPDVGSNNGPAAYWSACDGADMCIGGLGSCGSADVVGAPGVQVAVVGPPRSAIGVVGGTYGAVPMPEASGTGNVASVWRVPGDPSTVLVAIAVAGSADVASGPTTATSAAWLGSSAAGATTLAGWPRKHVPSGLIGTS